MVVNSLTEVHDVLRRRYVLIILITAALSAVPSNLRSQGAQPWFGIWTLNLSKSGVSAQPARYKRVTSRIEPWNDGLKVTYDMVGVRGGVTHWEWTGRFDGRDYPVQGTDTVLTNAYRKIDDRSYEIVIKVDGSLAATSRVTVSPDGKALHIATVERMPGGGTANTTAVYEKQR